MSAVKNIQSFISNISAPKKPEQLFYWMREREGYDIEILLNYEA